MEPQMELWVLYDHTNQTQRFAVPLPTTTTAPSDEPGTAQPEKRRPPFAITLSAFTFSVAALAEAWECEGEGEDDTIEDEYSMTEGTLPPQVGPLLVEVGRRRLWGCWRRQVPPTSAGELWLGMK